MVLKKDGIVAEANMKKANAVVTEKLIPLDEKIKELLKAGDERSVSEAKNLVDGYMDWYQKMLERGIIDVDEYNTEVLGHVGIDRKGNVKGIDFSHLRMTEGINLEYYLTRTANLLFDQLCRLAGDYGEAGRVLRSHFSERGLEEKMLLMQDSSGREMLGVPMPIKESPLLNYVFRQSEKDQPEEERLLVETDFLRKNLSIVETLLADSKDNVLLRVPVEPIEYVDAESIRSFLSAFQETSKGYVELFYMTGVGEVSEGVYRKLGLRKTSLPKDLKARTKQNTISLFSVMKGEVSSDLVQAKKDIDILLKIRLGTVEVAETQIVPVGWQNDPAGLVRGAHIGLQLIHLARQKEHTKNSDKEFAETAASAIRDLLGAEEGKFTDSDMMRIAFGSPGECVISLYKLIRLLPMDPVDLEELRVIYEEAAEQFA